jgi:hypothetical protein
MLPLSSVLLDVAGSLDFSTSQPTRRLVPEYHNFDYLRENFTSYEILNSLFFLAEEKKNEEKFSMVSSVLCERKASRLCQVL